MSKSPIPISGIACKFNWKFIMINNCIFQSELDEHKFQCPYKIDSTRSEEKFNKLLEEFETLIEENNYLRNSLMLLELK